MEIPTPRTPALRVRIVLIVTLLSAVWLGGLWLYVSAHDASDDRQRRAALEENAVHIARIAELTEARLKREAAERKDTASKITASIVAGVKASTSTITIPDAVLKLPCNHGDTHVDPARIDAIVNKQHCIMPLNYLPPNLVTDGEVTLAKPAYDAYRAMVAAAAAEGVIVSPTSSFRSYELQVVSYADWYRKLGSSSLANGVSALPGYSEHQLGLAVDFRTGGCALECFGISAAYVWLDANAHKYGYIERYPLGKEQITGYGAESWHWRYVGSETATEMREKKIATLEELWQTPGGDY